MDAVLTCLFKLTYKSVYKNVYIKMHIKIYWVQKHIWKNEKICMKKCRSCRNSPKWLLRMWAEEMFFFNLLFTLHYKTRKSHYFSQKEKWKKNERKLIVFIHYIWNEVLSNFSILHFLIFNDFDTIIRVR